MVFKRRAARLLILAPWLALMVMVPFFPAAAMAAALRGTAIWWEVLFPALFPFFVVTEILLGVGIVHFIGTLLDPLMRPLFRVPGYGGFVMAMGFASGYPIGARLTAELRKQKLVNRTEGERLVAFTTSSDPIFLIGAVSVGFFHDPSLAVVLACAHYGGSVLVGLIMRYYGADKPAGTGEKESDERTPDPSSVAGLPALNRRAGPLWQRALRAMHEARLADERSLSELLAEAVKSGLKLVMMVGALVVFLSVVLELLGIAGMLSLLEAGATALLARLALPGEMATAFINGLFEVTLGARAAGAEGSVHGLVHRTAMAGFVLSWAGLSVHAQIVSLLAETDLSYRPFVRARLLHGILTFVLVYALWSPLSGLRHLATAHVPAASFGTPDLFPLGPLLCLLLFISVLVFLPLLRLALLLSSGFLSIMMRRTK